MKSRIIHLFLSLTVMMSLLGGFAVNAYAQAPQPPPTAPPAVASSLALSSKFPVLSAESGGSYDFEVEVKYTGLERKRFDLSISVPQDWVGFALSSYPEKQVAAIELGPAELGVTENMKVRVAPVFWKLPDMGDYPVTFTVSSGTLKQSMTFTAKVTAKYNLSITTDSGRLNTEATAGQDNHFAIKLVNSGSAAIDKVTFSSTKPEGWIVKFTPDKFDSLGAGLTQEVDIVINPPSGKTIAGDYIINIKAESQKISSDVDLRVTVLTPTIWGWVGIIIVLVVIAGLAVVFRQLGRR